MKIEPITPKDIQYLSKIMQSRWDLALDIANQEARRFLVADKDTGGFVAHNDLGKPVGVGLFDSHNEDVSKDYCPWFYLLWVDPEYRGQGLGIELTKRRMDHARQFGYKEVYLDTTDARAYHLALGWEDVRTIDYEGKTDYIMKYDLSEPFPKKVLV